MKIISTIDLQSGEEINLAYCDYGQGRPVVLIHGWPLSMEMWEYQLNDLVSAGLRVIKYDRRGFGKSSKPWDGYDYDSLANDLKAVLDELDLRDVTLVGFSMGGGEVARYLNRFGSERVSKVVLISSVLPFMSKTAGNDEGVDVEVFDNMLNNIKEDRIGFLDSFGKQFFGVNMLNHPVSEPLLQYYRMLASFASQRSTEKCAEAFATTDFRDDIKAISLPTLIIHGDDDKTVPIEASSDRTAKMIPNAQYIVYEGAPHGLFYTHKDRLNEDLISFITSTESVYLENAKDRDMPAHD
jgi:non-heme chloroperoxidase